MPTPRSLVHPEAAPHSRLLLLEAELLTPPQALV